MSIVAHPTRTRTCNNCLIVFRPRNPRHRYCGDCYAWRRIYLGTMATRQALQETGR